MGALLNRARMTVSGTPGAGTITLLAAAAGFQTFSSAGAVDGGVYSYVIEDGTSWEFGLGTYTASGTTLARTTILASSNSGSAISATSGATVFISALASDIPSTAGGFVNKFRNGTMDVAQRGASSITVTTAGAYVLDGWIVTPTGASCTALQSTAIASVGPAPSLNAMLILGATGVTGLTCKQRIESMVAAPLAGKLCTVQAIIFNSTGGSITPTLTIKHPTSTADAFGSTTTDISAVSLQACANNAATTIAYTFLAAAASYNGIEVTFDFGNNFSTNVKGVYITCCDIRATPHTVAGLNSAPPTPELRPVAIEKDYCQEYLWVLQPGLIVAQLATGLCTSTTAAAIILNFPQTMRAAPTLAISAAGDFELITAAGAVATCTALTLTRAHTSSAQLAATVASGMVAGNATLLFAQATGAALTFSAEL